MFNVSLSATCAQDGSGIGWGPWSVNAGLGVTNFTVQSTPGWKRGER